MRTSRCVALYCAGALLLGCQEATAPDAVAIPSESVTLLALSNTWSSRAPLLYPRSNMPAAALNGIIYVVGGASSAAYVSRTLQAYNAATNTWTTRQSLPAARGYLNGASFINGRLYVTGGYDGSSGFAKTLFVYNPVTNSWARKADMPVAGILGAQGVIGGVLYAYLGSAAGPNWDAFFRYDPATNTWKTLARPPTWHEAGVGGVINGKFYLVGGKGGRYLNPQRILNVYNPVTNTWTTKAPMKSERRGFFGGVINGKLYVAGGWSDWGATPSGEVYDPTTNLWTTTASLPCDQHDGASAVATGRLFAIGGADCPLGVTKKVYAYTP